MCRDQGPQDNLQHVGVQRSRRIDPGVISSNPRHRHSENERIQAEMDDLCHKAEDCRFFADHRRPTLDATQTHANNRKCQYGGADIGVTVGRRDLVGGRNAAATHRPMPFVHAIGKQQIKDDDQSHPP